MSRFVAEEVLAKHDENYMPPEVADSLKPHMDAANNAPESNNRDCPGPWQHLIALTETRPVLEQSPHGH